MQWAVRQLLSLPPSMVGSPVQSAREGCPCLCLSGHLLLYTLHSMLFLCVVRALGIIYLNNSTINRQSLFVLLIFLIILIPVIWSYICERKSKGCGRVVSASVVGVGCIASSLGLWSRKELLVQCYGNLPLVECYVHVCAFRVLLCHLYCQTGVKNHVVWTTQQAALHLPVSICRAFRGLSHATIPMLVESLVKSWGIIPTFLGFWWFGLV